MVTRRKLVSICTALTVTLTVFSIARAASLSDIVGTYKLVSARNFGEAASGILMFDAKGHFSLIAMRGDLPKFASNKRVEGTAEEYKATVTGSLAYYGTYTVSGTDLLLSIEKSTFANWDGTQSKRVDLTIAGDQLKYTAPNPSAGGVPD